MIDFDITPYLSPDDPWPAKEGLALVVRLYDDKYQIARLIRPQSVLEVGVRYGYSAAVFLAAGATSYTGLDADLDKFGGRMGAIDYARKMLPERFPGAKIEIHKINTQEAERLLYGPVDLVHVDGDHTYEGALHDLHLAAGLRPKWILTDDITWHASVHAASCDFLRRTGYRAIVLPTARGDCLIQVAGI